MRGSMTCSPSSASGQRSSGCRRRDDEQLGLFRCLPVLPVCENLDVAKGALPQESCNGFGCVEEEALAAAGIHLSGRTVDEGLLVRQDLRFGIERQRAEVEAPGVRRRQLLPNSYLAPRCLEEAPLARVGVQLEAQEPAGHQRLPRAIEEPGGEPLLDRVEVGESPGDADGCREYVSKVEPCRVAGLEAELFEPLVPRPGTREGDPRVRQVDPEATRDPPASRELDQQTSVAAAKLEQHRAVGEQLAEEIRLLLGVLERHRSVLLERLPVREG